MQSSTENTRIHGSVIHTPLSTLPEQFTFGPHTEAMSKYLSRRWSAHSYGWFKRYKAIEYNQPFTPEARKRETWRWIEHPADGLRFIGKAHEIRGSGDGNIPYFDRRIVEHNGWYVDSFQDETVCGEVYQMPARSGKEMYIPAIEDHNGNDGAILSFPDATEDLLQAIRTADSMAEWYAEDEREYEAKDRAEQRIGEISEEIQTARSEFKALARELRANCDRISGMAELRKLVRREYKSMRHACAKLYRERDRLKDNFWTSVEA